MTGHAPHQDVFTGGREAGWIAVVVETPGGSRNEYEFDHERGVFRLDRVLYSAVHYPADYGYAPGTLSLDGDPPDALVIVDEPAFPRRHVRARPVGTLIMVDEKGEDEKVLAAPHDDPRFAQTHNLHDLATHWQLEIAAFFRTYKELQGVQTEARDWRDVADAWGVIEAARARYLGHP